MANDTREDHGSYYPGAKVIVSGSGTSGTSTDVSGKVDRVAIGKIGDTYTLKTVKEKVDSLIKAMAPIASCLAAMLYMSTAMAATEVLEDIPSNARVVVSEDDPVALAAIPEVVGAATNAAIEAAKAYADAAVGGEASNRADAVEDVLVRSKSYTDTATNTLAAKIPVIDLDPYATKSWVEAKGYVTSDALGGVATKEWIGDQGYLTLLEIAPYATIDWVLGKGYATASDINGLATKSELDALKRRYADTNGVTRLWSEDGLTMTDGTGVVWSVSWAAVTNWVSLTNGIVYRPTAPGVWIGDGIITNGEGAVGVGRIEYGRGMPEWFAFGLDGGGSYAEAVAEGLYLDYSDAVAMLPDAFTGIVERAALYVPIARVVTNDVGYVASGIITDGTNTITAAGDAIAAGIGKGYWMVRRIPDGTWRKLVPVPESYNALWRDVETNSYVGDYSGAPDGMWTGSVDGFSNTFYIPAERYEAFSNSNAEGYYVPDRKTLATVDQIPTTPEQIGAARVGAVQLLEDVNSNKTAVTIGKRNEDGTVGQYSLANGQFVNASGYSSHAEGEGTTASGQFSHSEGQGTTASGYYSHAEGYGTTASGHFSHADGYESQTIEGHQYSFVWNGDTSVINRYSSHGSGTFNINPVGGSDGFYIGEKTLSDVISGIVTNNISADNPTFSNAVLAVGLNIDTNSVAVMNEIAETFGGFPIEGAATTVGGLLAALAAAATWLKKNKVGSFASVGGASATVENGVAKLDDFFTESNSLLNGRLAYSRNETGLKDRAFNTLSFDGTEFNLSAALEAVTPTASGQPRDLLIVATATAATTISYTAGTIKGDKPTIDGAGTWLITLTEYASGVWYCRQIKMEDAA